MKSDESSSRHWVSLSRSWPSRRVLWLSETSCLSTPAAGRHWLGAAQWEAQPWYKWSHECISECDWWDSWPIKVSVVASLQETFSRCSQGKCLHNLAFQLSIPVLLRKIYKKFLKYELKTNKPEILKMQSCFMISSFRTVTAHRKKCLRPKD